MTPWLKLAKKTPVVESVPERLFLSDNDKTGCSVNVSIALSCRPTAACSHYCYGANGPISWDAALATQVENYLRFAYLETADPEVLEEEILHLVKTVERKQNWLRMFGVGDLQKGSVRFINAMATIAPWLSLWVSTRRFELAEGLIPQAHLNVMMSLDHTTREDHAAIARKLARRKGFFLAWVQTQEEDAAPRDVKVVFAEHRGGGRAGWSENAADPRTCPATVDGGAPHAGACGACRYCLDQGIRATMSKGPWAHYLKKETL